MQTELLLDSLSDNIFALDTGGNITYLNAHCAATLSLKKEEAIGKKIWNLRSSVICKEAHRAIREVLEKPEGKIIEWSSHSENSFWEMKLFPTEEGVAGIFRDITTDKKARLALEESEAKYRNLVENSKDSIIIVDFKGNVLFANHVSETLTGYSINEISNIRDVTPKKLWMKSVSILLRARMGKPIPFFEYEIIRKDGATIPVETGGQAIIKNGKPVAIQIITRDVTERKKAEQALGERNKKLAESEARYRELYDSLDQAFIATDWDLNITHWNKAAEMLTQQKASQAIGKKMYDVLPNYGLIDVNRYYDSLIVGKNVHFTVNYPSLETGKQSIFKISVYPSANGILYIIEDKTEEETNRRLSAIGATASMVGHDIRNPLQAIVGDVFLIKNSMEEMSSSNINDEVQESLADIDSNVSYMNKIIADLQDYSRQLCPEFEEVDLFDLLRAVCDAIDVPANVALSINVKHLKLKVDPEFIRRALVNLVTNAIQAMPNGGEVALSGFEKGGQVHIVVADNGIGIPREIKSKLFAPMVTTKSKGQGLGLAVVKRLVEALDGDITFESEVNEGTKFIITLPKKG